MPTEDRLRSLKSEFELASSNAPFAQECAKWRADRSPETIAALLKLLDDYRNGEISLKEFQVTFDKQTRTAWDIMGLKGMSGAMFLNTLVKYVPDQPAVDAALKIALPKPVDAERGLIEMASFADVVEQEIKRGNIAKTHVQTARVPFFLSA